jgi:hypothetical protein
VSNVEARNAGRQNGIAVRLTDIEYSTIHDVQTAQLFGLVNNSEFYNISYPATGRGVVGSNQGFDTTPYHENNTYVEGWDGSGLPALRPGLIYNNVFHDITTGSGAIYPNGCPSTPFYIFNNVVYNNYWNSVVQIDQYGGSGTCGDYYIWNNTFQIPSSNNFSAIRKVDRAGISIKNLNVQNNHFIQDSVTSISGNGVSQTINNNLLQTNNSANLQGYNLSTFFSPSQSGGSTINTGTNLSANCTGQMSQLCNSTSFAGTRSVMSRGVSWDIGAYEYNG